MVELCLVAYLGRRGTECLREVNTQIPESFLHLKKIYAYEILTSLVPGDEALNIEKAKMLCELVATRCETNMYPWKHYQK